MRNKINDYLLAYEKLEYFSGTVLVAQDGEVLLHEGYGLATMLISRLLVMCRTSRMGTRSRSSIC